MSLKPRCFDPIPEETVRAAQAAFPKGNGYLRRRDELGPLYVDEAFAELFSTRGQPAEAPGCLALVMVMQFAEGLSDRQAADAVRARIDWKYALGLKLTDAGFDASVLSEFRRRLLAGGAEAVLFETLLERCRQAGLVKARTRQRTDSTHVLAAIQMLNRLEWVGETLRHALTVLAVVEPDWLQAHVPPLWFERYGQRVTDYRLPAERTERYALAETIGSDGFALLDRIDAATAPGWLRDVPAVEVLRQVWVHQFYGPDEQVRWRAASDLPPSAGLIGSPDDAEARYAKKRSVVWVGYKVHLTETCDEDTVHLITDVQTTPATTADSDRLPTIQADLAARQLLPAEPIVDTGYVTAEHLVTSQQTPQINLLGPVMPDTSWQAQAPDRFDVATFGIDWEAQTATCPQGQVSRQWQPSQSQHGQPVIRIQFARTDCQACPVHPQCTLSPHRGRRLTVRPRDQHEALQAARQRQTTEPFKDAYAARAGVEGTLSQGVRDCNLRRSRYIGLAKTRLHHLLAATAINLLRIGAWLAGRPRAKTRRSAFAALAPALS
jgi:transposase